MNSTVITLQNAAAANGNGMQIAIPQYNNIGLQVLGTFTAVVNFEASYDGGNTWAAVPLMDSTGAWKTNASAPGIFSTYLAVYPLFRARVAWTSGTSVTVLFAGKG